MESKTFGLACFLGAIVVVLGWCNSTSGSEPISYRLDQLNGRTVIRSSTGEVIPWTTYSNPYTAQNWLWKYRVFARLGTHLYQTAAVQTKDFAGHRAVFWNNPFWSSDGLPFETPRDVVQSVTHVEEVLKFDPKARFIIRLQTPPTHEWRTLHQADFLGLDGKSVDTTKRLTDWPSLASEAYLAGLEDSIRRAISFHEAQPWRDCIVGYTLYPPGEGITEVALEGRLFDTTPAMNAAFQKFVVEKYDSDAALQAAWGDPDVTRSSVRVPTLDEWEHKVSSRKILHWPDPAETRRERDYFECNELVFHNYCRRKFQVMSDATRARPVLKGYDMFKQPLQGWFAAPEFSGQWRRGEMDRHGETLLGTGSSNVATLLDDVGFDLLQTPGMYFNRGMGSAWESEGVTDSLVLRGKANFTEADLRTFVDYDDNLNRIPQQTAPSGTFMDIREVRAGFHRTLAWALSRNQMYYLMTLCYSDYWYFDREVESVIEEQWKVLRATDSLPWRETEHAICLVLDDRAALHEDFSSGYQHLAVFRQLQEALALCGVPYRIHLLSDLDHERMPSYRTWLFPNLFKVDDEVIAKLKKRVLRNGNVAIFGPGTGITDGKTRSAVMASKLLGTPMEIQMSSVPRRVVMGAGEHPLAKRLPVQSFGDNYAYGPLLVPIATRLTPETGSARPLGSAWFYYGVDRPGLFVNEMGNGAAGNPVNAGKLLGEGDYAVVFSTAVPLPPELLRECARYAGSTVWSEQNAVVYGCDTFVALHTIKSGKQTIRLPRRATLVDVLSGQKKAENVESVDVEIEAPGTVMFWMK